MPFQSKRELVCKRCGKRFTVTMGDAIMPKDAQLLENPICPKCKAITKVAGKTHINDK